MRRLSLGAAFDQKNDNKRDTSRNCLFPPTRTDSQHRTLHVNEFEAVRQLAPQDQTKEWWKMLYGDKGECLPFKTNNIPKSAPSKSCLSSTKRKRAHGDLTPNANNTSFLSAASEHTPLRSAIRCVKFGSASAAEFEKNDPPQGSLTPMPPTKAAERFPTDYKEPDAETADLIAMTKGNSATLAEWDFFDDGDDDDVFDDTTRSPLEDRRSRRESGRFIPLNETETFDMDETYEQTVTSAESEELLVDLSSTAVQLFTNLAVSIRAEMHNNETSQQQPTSLLERQLLECKEPICCAMIEECLDDTLRSCANPKITIIQEKRIQYKMKSNSDAAAGIIARTNFQFQSAFTDSLESINWEELQTRIKIDTEKVSKAILRTEKASRRNLFHAIAKEEEAMKLLEQDLLAAQIRKEHIRRQCFEKLLLCKSRAPLTYYVMNFIAPFRLVDSSGSEITLEFSTSIEKRRLELTADIRRENFAFKQSEGVDDGSIVNIESIATIMSRAILSATCMELEPAVSSISLPCIVFRVAQVLHRLDRFIERFMALTEYCDDVSVTEDDKALSVSLHLPDMTKAELTYNLSGPLLLQPNSLRPTVSMDGNGNQATELHPALSRFLNVSNT